MIKKGINEIRPKGEKIFSVLFAGDFCVRNDATLDVIEAGRADVIVKDIKPFFDAADIKVLQWEVVCGMEGDPIPKSGPNLHNPVFCTDFAKALGVDITLLANNHTGDFGPEMAVVTRDRLESAGFKTVGVGKDLEEAGKALYVEKSGVKIAFLNFCENEFGTAGVDKAGTNPYSPIEIFDSIQKAKKEADLVFLAMHGGHEQNPLPSPRMTKEFRFYAQNGADIVFNCHTHCPEGVEVVGDTPIVYSPGNFFFPKDCLFGGNEASDRVWRTGYLSKFYCDENGVFAYELIPYRFEFDKITPLTGDAEDKFFAYINKITAPINDAATLRNYFEGWCFKSGFNGYFNTLKGGLPDLTDETRKSYLPMRNLLTCESHNDLMKNTMRIAEEGREKEAEAYCSELKEFTLLDF